MNDGDKVRLIGEGGAPLLLTVGTPFSAQFIEARIAAGVWQKAEAKAPAPAKNARRKRTA